MSKSPLPRRVTASYLENVALYYLGRFAASTASLRRVLMRRVHRAAEAFGDDAADGEAMVADILERFARSGLLDDRRYAEAKAQSLFRRGSPLKAVGRQLAMRGIEPGIVAEILAVLAADTAESGGDADILAARAYARRRRLGPWRDEAARAAARDRDLAAMGRAGFSWPVASAVIDGEKD